MSLSLTNLLAALNLKQASSTSPANQNIQLNNSISSLNQSIQSLGDRLNETPFVAINTQGATLSVNSAANTLIFAGVPVPTGYKAVIKDFNVNFTTSGGSVSIVIMDYNAKNVLNTITANVSSSASGFGGTVIDETQCIAIIVNTQGAGVVTAYISGMLQKKVTLS